MNDGDALHALTTAVQAELGGKDYRSAAPADRDDYLAALRLADLVGMDRRVETRSKPRRGLHVWTKVNLGELRT
jgi:hypothetical protein